jgi:hypothetical protein
MEIQRFDALARQLGQDGTRRRLLGLFGGTALGGLLAAGLIGDDAEAKKRKKKKKKSCKKKKCGECQTCRKGKCLAKADGTACTGGTCEGGICRTVNNCPPAQVCDLADTCCTEGINCFDDVCFCGEEVQVVCSCPAGDEYCEGTDGAQCCLASDGCNVAGYCTTDTCSASNDFCELEFAACGDNDDNCGCVSSTDGANLCASFEEFACPATSQCTTDSNCSGDDVCVDIGCRCTGTFLGLCLQPCAVNLQGAAARRAGSQRLRDRVGPLR